MRLQGMGLNSFFLDAIDCKAIKVRPPPTIKTAFLIIALCQKLSITNISELLEQPGVLCTGFWKIAILLKK